LKRESIWAHQKNIINKKPDDKERINQFDLTNFERRIDQASKDKFANKRERKIVEKKK